MRKPKSRSDRFAWHTRLVAVCATLLIVLPATGAHAYNEMTHRRIVDHAYQIMRAVRYELGGGRLRRAEGGTAFGQPIVTGTLLDPPASPAKAGHQAGGDAVVLLVG